MFVIAIRNLEAIRKRKKYTGDKFRNAAAAAYNVIKQLKLFLFDDKNNFLFSQILSKINKLIQQLFFDSIRVVASIPPSLSRWRPGFDSPSKKYFLPIGVVQ